MTERPFSRKRRADSAFLSHNIWHMRRAKNSPQKHNSSSPRTRDFLGISFKYYFRPMKCMQHLVVRESILRFTKWHIFLYGLLDLFRQEIIVEFSSFFSRETVATSKSRKGSLERKETIVMCPPSPHLQRWKVTTFVRREMRTPFSPPHQIVQGTGSNRGGGGGGFL